jgi:hypothetical protein
MRAERGGASIWILVLLLVVGAGAFWWMHHEGGKAQGFAFSDYAGFRLVHGKLADKALEDVLLQTADHALRAHGLQSRGEGLAAAADEVAVVLEPSPTSPDTAVNVRLRNAAGADVWSVQLSAMDPARLSEIAQANLAALLNDPRSERK